MLVRTPETAWWIFRYTRNGRAREMGLGRARGRNSVTLAEARVKAAGLVKQVRSGVDPLAQREADRAAALAAAQADAARAVTFEAAATQYMHAHRAGWRNSKHAGQWRATLATYAYPHMGAVPVANVDTTLVLAVLEPIWRTKPETAGRVRGRIEAVLDYARTREWRTGENPASWKHHLDHLLPARGKVRRVEHHAALSWREVGAFMVKLCGQAGIGARALEFAILTAARSGEVRGARWSEIDLQAAVWTVPAERMKAARAHRVPLSEPALAILRHMRTMQAGPGALLFPGAREGTPLSAMTLTATLRRMGRGDLTVHGFRSSFRDWCAERTNYPRELAEAALAHVVGSKVEAAYQRGDMYEKRARMMADWATFCSQPGAASTIVFIRSSA